MELVKELRPYYIRKQRVEVAIKLPDNATEASCAILDHSGEDITLSKNLFYSNKNILKANAVQREPSVCFLVVYFERAHNLVTLKVTAKGRTGAVVGELYRGFRVYSQEPKVRPQPTKKRKMYEANGEELVGWVGGGFVNNNPPVDVDFFDFDFKDAAGTDGVNFPAPSSPSPVPVSSDKADRFIGVPSLPNCFVEELHDKITNVAISQLLGKDRQFIGLVGMIGVGKTAVLSRIARNETILKNFSGGIYWMRAGFDTLDSYQRVVGIGNILKQDISNEMKDPRRAMESLLTLTGNNALVIVDDVYSAEQVRAIEVEVERFPGTKLVFGTCCPGIVKELGACSLTIPLPSMQHSVQLMSRLTKSTPNKEESEHMKALVTCLGNLPLAIVIASRSFTRLIGYQEILSEFKNRSLFGVGAKLEYFSRGVQKKIKLIDAPSRMCLFLLSVIPHSHNRALVNSRKALVDEHGSVMALITFQPPFFVVPLPLLERIWNVDQTEMKLSAQGLIDAGFLLLGDGNEAVTSVRVHSLLLRYLDVAAGGHEEIYDRLAPSINSHVQISTNSVEEPQMLFSMCDLYFNAPKEHLVQLYNVIMQSAASPNFLVEFKARKKDLPDLMLSATRSLQPAAAHVTGVANAIREMKAKVALKHLMAREAKQTDAPKWLFHTELLAAMEKTVDDYYNAILHATIDCNEFKKKDLNERVYNTEKAFTYLTDLVNFGWQATAYSMAPVQVLVRVDEMLGYVRSRKYDHNGRLVLGFMPVDPEVRTGSNCKTEDMMQWWWMLQHAYLFDQNCRENGMCFLSSVSAMKQTLQHPLVLSNPMEIRIVMDRLQGMLFLREQSASKFYLCAEGSPDGIFYESVSILFDRLFNDINFCFIRNESVFQNMCQTYFSEDDVARDEFWRSAYVNLKKT